MRYDRRVREAVGHARSGRAVRAHAGPSLKQWAVALMLACAACGDDVAAPVDAATSDGGARPDAALRDGGELPDRAGPREDAGLVRVEGFVEATGPVDNPDRGLYAWDWDTSVDLVLVKPHLGVFCDGAPLSATFLDGLRTRLSDHRDAGRRVILRFVYADDGTLNPCMRADAESVDVIETHLASLAPVLAEHADVIAFVEAGLLGMWGEWNSEHAPSGTDLWTDPEVRRRVVVALLDAVPSGRSILLRRPRFREELEPVLSAADLARVGHHNDCLFASATDYGTYDGARTPDEWKSYIAAISETAPVGGETCVDEAAFTACENALPELERLGYTYVHQNYQRAVIDRWRAEGCFDEIERRLGYRVILRAVEAPQSVSAGASFPVVLEIENVGFAPPYVTRRIGAALAGDAGRTELGVTALGGADSRGWLDGETVRVELELAVPAEAPFGEHQLRIVLSDDRSEHPAHRMLFANEPEVRDDAARENVVATITVR